MTRRMLSYPHDWQQDSLRDLLSSLTSGSRPIGGGNGDSNGVFSLGGEHITDDGRFVFDNHQYVPTAHYEEIKEKAGVSVGDILINKDGAKTGKLALVRQDFPFVPACINEHLFRLRVDNQRIEPEYLFNFLLSSLGQYQIQAEVQGSAQGGIIRRFAKFVQVGFPKESNERKRILCFLDAVDLSLDAARAELLAAKRLKTALMQQLFTKGIPGRHSKFQTISVFRRQTQIPREWEPSLLGANTIRIEYGTNAPSNVYNAGYPVIAIPQVVAPRLELVEVPHADLSEAEAAALRLEDGDVLLIRTNGNPNYMGKSTLVTVGVASQHVVFASYLIRIRTDKTRLLGSYLNYFLASPLGRQQALAMSNTSAGNHNLGARSLKRFLLPRPDMKEQEEIVEVLDHCEDTLDAISNKISALARLKKSLFQNLLTGKVRVNREAQV